MPSRIKVDEIAGSSGNTITIPSGQTLDASSGTLTLPASALSSLNASNLSSGTVPNARLSGITRDKLDLISTASDASIVAKGTAGVTDGYIQLNCEQNSHGIKIKSPVHASGANYTLVMPPSLGTASQVLRMNSGATALEFGTVSSDFVKIHSTGATNGNTISVDGYFSSTYKNYIVRVLGARVAGFSGNRLNLRVNTGGSASSSSLYAYVTSYDTVSSDLGNWSSGFSANLVDIGYVTNTSSTEDAVSSFTINFFDPENTNNFKPFTYEGAYFDGTGILASQDGACSFRSTTALTGFTFGSNAFNGTGTIYVDDITIYGLK